MTTYTELLPVTKSEKHGALTWAPAAETATVGGVLTITGKRNHCRYRVEEYPAGATGRAFMLLKLGAGAARTEERYACLLPADGPGLCECRGFAATRGCKHLAALVELVKAKQL